MIQTSMTDQANRKALEAFLINNDDLEKLEAMIAEFNIFEAIGMIQQEVKHSQLLAMLLDPNGNHGLDDLFLKRLLMAALRDVATSPITPLDLDLIELSNAEVQREWNNIDILITDPVNHIAFIIENKVFTGEHDNQLQRYWDIVQKQYRDCRIVGLYLTPDGSSPSNDNYIPISYVQVAEVLEGMLKTRSSVMGSDICTLINHYITMLRRHIVTDSEIAELCRRIYAKHQRALDLIFEHRPDLQSEIARYLGELTRLESSLRIYAEGKTQIFFRPTHWDRVPSLMTESESRHGGRDILMFDWVNGTERVDVRLYIGPGPQDIRKQLFEMAGSRGKPFELSQRTMGSQWHSISNCHILRATDLADPDPDSLKRKIKDRWREFLEKDMPHFDAFVTDFASLVDRNQ